MASAGALSGSAVSTNQPESGSAVGVGTGLQSHFFFSPTWRTKQGVATTLRHRVVVSVHTMLLEKLLALYFMIEFSYAGNLKQLKRQEAVR